MTKTNKPFDFEQFKQQAREQLKGGASLLGADGVLTPLIKQFLEESLEAELGAHLDEQAAAPNRRNGKGTKRVRTSLGPVEIETPRDRAGSFAPKILPKRKRQLSADLDRQIIALYARGSSYGDIRDYLLEMYDLEVSTATMGDVSSPDRVTDKILPLPREWRSRPLEAIYPFVWLDAIHYKVRHEGRVVTKAIYCVIGLNQEGYKELLGLYVGEQEGAKFWLQVLTVLKNRGIEDIFIACIDNLQGFAEAVESIFPQTEVQLCIIHQILGLEEVHRLEGREGLHAGSEAGLPRPYEGASRGESGQAGGALGREVPGRGSDRGDGTGTACRSTLPTPQRFGGSFTRPTSSKASTAAYANGPRRRALSPRTRP